MVRHTVAIVGSAERHEIFEYYMTYALFAYTLRGNPLHWYATLPEKSIHSFHHLIIEIDRDFNLTVERSIKKF